MKLKKAIADYLMNQLILQPFLDTRVYRKKAPATTGTPFVVYDTTGYQNRLGKYQATHGYQGNKLTIDIVWRYEEDDLLHEISDIIVSLLWWFIGHLTPDRSWTIALEWSDEGYDPETNYSTVRLFFLCKNTF